jgi:uncharacterized membrane protein YhaH (DUF805 family)
MKLKILCFINKNRALNRRNYLAAFALLWFLNIFHISQYLLNLGAAVFAGRFKSTEFLAMWTTYARYVDMSFPWLFSWHFLLFLGCAFILVKAYEGKLPKALACFLGIPFFLFFKCLISVFFVFDQFALISLTFESTFQTLVRETELVFCGFALIGLISFLIPFLFLKSSSGANRSGKSLDLDREGFLLRSFGLSLISCLAGAFFIFLLFNFKYSDPNGILISAGVFLLIMGYLAFTLMKKRLSNAGKSSWQLLVFLISPVMIYFGVRFLFIEDSIFFYEIGTILVSLAFEISALFFLYIALIPESSKKEKALSAVI